MAFKVSVIAAAALLTGCITPQGEALKSEVLSKGALVADEVLEESIEIPCSKRFSLRAYESYLARRGKSWRDMSDWCGWGEIGTPPEE